MRGNKTEEMFPEHDLSIRHVRVGETLMVGVRPKPVWVDGVNANPILKNSGLKFEIKKISFGTFLKC